MLKNYSQAMIVSFNTGYTLHVYKKKTPKEFQIKMFGTFLLVRRKKIIHLTSMIYILGINAIFLKKIGQTRT